MKFTDGFWHVRPGVDALYAQEAYDIEVDSTELYGEGLRGTRAGRRGGC